MRAPSTQRPHAITRALLGLDVRLVHEDLLPTVEDDAARFILEDAYAFLLASCLNCGTSAAITWTIPSWLKRHCGHLAPLRVRIMSDEDLAPALDQLPKRPRCSGDAVATICELTPIIEALEGEVRLKAKQVTTRPGFLNEVLGSNFVPRAPAHPGSARFSHTLVTAR